MIRSQLQDAAVAAAKTYCHAEVAPRHVIFAAARHLRERPEIGSLLQAAKSALEPRGESYGAPKLTTEAATLLESISTDQDALAAVLKALSAGPVAEAQAPPPVVAPVGQKPGTADTSKAAAAPSAETTAELLKELDSYIGLGSVKAQVRSIIAVVQANEARKKAELAPVSAGLHLVFTGPPGTGKTTVARLIARLYASTGALAGAKFTEASRSDLVAGYVGQTAIKTTDLIARTRPGVLFIDEAYALTPRHDSDFGAEAIATLVKAMEDYRNDFAVIAAGYGEEMNQFVGSNPGLRSRFKTFVEFPNYGVDELTQIFARFVKECGLGLEAGALEKAGRIFDRAVGKQEFGNARFARSLFEQAYARMAARAAADGLITVEEVTEIACQDLEWQEAGFEPEKRRIGFGGTDPAAGTSPAS